MDTFAPRTPLHNPRPSASERPAGAVIDIAVLKELAVMLGGEDDPLFLQERLEDFYEDAETLMSGIRAAVAGQDARELKQTAHTLKSSSAMFGATVFAKVCADLEHMGATGHLAGAEEKVAWLNRAFPHVCAALRAASRA